MLTLPRAALGLATATLLSLPCLAAAPTPSPVPQDGEAPPPALSDKTLDVTMTTSLGEMVFTLDYGKAPITVANFLKYARDGFYEGTIFHRVLKDFMAQGGGFDGDLKLKKTGDAIPNEADNGLKNVFGALAMARRPDPHSATSQFFINCKANSFLDHQSKTDRGWGYCVFGQLAGGQDVFEALRNVPVERNTSVGREVASPVTQVVIQKVAAKDPKLAEQVIAAGDAALKKAQDAIAAERAAPMQAGIDFVTSKGYDVTKGKFMPSGLWVLDVKQGEGEFPGPTQTVSVDYTGWLPDGTKFDSSRDRGQPAQFPLNGVISGWTEGVGGMKPGGRRFLVIPYQMAYGESGRPPQIPPKATLVFDVELLKIVK